MNNRHTGFTLIELLVTMAIVGILAATAIVNFGKNEDRDVRAGKERLTTFLREVQNKALAGDVPSNSLVSACYIGSNFICNKICGYGIRVANASSTSLQAYFAYDNTDINSNCTDKTKWQKKDLEVFYIQNEVTASSPNDILFHVPNGEVYRDDNPLTSGFITITLKKGAITNSDTKVDFSGNIK